MKKVLGILKLALPYKGYAFLNIIFNLISAIFNLVSLLLFIPFLQLLFGNTPLVTEKPAVGLSQKALTDLLNYHLSQSIIESGPVEALWIVCITIAAMFFFKNMFIYLGVYVLSTMRSGVVRDLRQKIYDKILALPLGYYSEERKGDIISRISNDVQEVEFSILNSLEMFFREPVIIILYLTVLIKLSPELTIFAFILLPITALVIGRVGKGLKKSSHLAQSKMGEIISVVEETLGGLRIIKAFTGEKSVKNRFGEVNQNYFQTMLKVIRLRDLASPLNEFLGALVMIALVWYGGQLVLSGSDASLNGEGFIGYLVVFSQLMRPTKNLTTAFSYVQKGIASAERINHILDAENPIKDSPNALPKNNFESGIEYKNVSFSYNGKDIVLNDINLKIEKGKTIALVGQSGSGKSTMIDLLPRFYDIENGDLLIDGASVKSYKIKDLRGLFGIVSQESILFNDTVFNNIAFGIENATQEAVEKAAKIANAHEFIVQLPNQYQTNIGDRGGKLSGGQRQRLSIARAVLKNPPILILDEATSALDSESERLVQDALNHLMQNRTSIVIAHRLSTIQTADEIIVMNKGRIIERGTHNELLAKNAAYTRLYEMQSFG